MPAARVDPKAVLLTTPLSDVHGVTPGKAEALGRLGVRTVADLIRHLPMRYETIEAEAPISALVEGAIGTARGDVTATRVSGGFGRGGGKTPRFQAVLADATGRLDLVWFNGTYLQSRVFPGLRLRVQGLVRRHGPGVQMANPSFEILPADDEPGEGREARVRPVYPASESINSAQIEKIVGLVLEAACAQIEDHLPAEYRHSRSLPELREAYRMAHQPAQAVEGDEARRRLAFDELLLLQLGVFLRRAQQRASVRAVALPVNAEVDKAIRARLPFALTNAQDRVVREIAQGLSTSDPTNRLLQGDVGSGKTAVALYAMLIAAMDGHQAALLAPTELLAEQHYASIRRMLGDEGPAVELLTGSLSQSERMGVLDRLASGASPMVVGTHALLGEKVRFESLAVAVVDEQHRFGVAQRAALREKGTAGAEQESSAALFQPSTPETPPPPGESDGRTVVPHVVVMTATPIPRTLAMTLLGDLDISTIDELPPGRSPIVTRVVSPAQSGDVYTFVRSRIDLGEQAYVVVPAIDTGASSAGAGGDAELNDLRTVVARLEAHELQGKRVAAVHGRLKSETRESIMTRFRAGEIDALVATTVIEVGVDVPNATVMVVEHAERFGLSQLHQLRGRVGRGSRRSVCVLIAEPVTPDAEARLAALARTTDGFELAEEDLKIRGPGEVFGLRQAGAPPLKVADLMRDRELLALARRDAQAWIERSPELRGEGEELLRKRLMRAHGPWLGLGDVG